MDQLPKAIRGMNDVLPDDTYKWLSLENRLRKLAGSYGYRQIRTPILEYTPVFERTVGEVTDIVSKEMYTFSDRKGQRMSLRPEGTAGCVRAYLQHGLSHRSRADRLWYLGPMFRYERPQKGRQRQFHQFGVEAFGMAEPDIEVELILMGLRLWQQLGISHKIQLHINSLGSKAERDVHREALLEYFQDHSNLLSEEEVQRLRRNPLRLLDSKNPVLKSVIEQAPAPLEYLGEASRNHFDTLRQLLDGAGVSYQVTPYLVRGLDYYGLTVFEWVTDSLGAQGTVCAGGRYDALLGQLGGKSSPAVGFSLGLERVLALIDEAHGSIDQPNIYVMSTDSVSKIYAMGVAEQLRSMFPDLCIILSAKKGTLRKQLQQANKVGAQWGVVVGETEQSQQTITVKCLSVSGVAQETMSLEDFCQRLRDFKHA